LLIAHVADTHLGYMQYNLEERFEDFNDAFREVVDKAINEHVDVLVHAGDAFHDPRPSIKALKFFREQLRRLHSRGIPVVAVPGSHDMLKRRGMPPLSLFDDLGLKLLTFATPTAEVKGVFFGGFQYLPRHRHDSIIAKLREIELKAREKGGKKVLVLHQALEHLLPIAYEISLAELPKSFNYYAMGHIHSHHVIPYGKGVLSYPGSTEVLSVDEIKHIDDKGFNIVDLSGDEPTIHRIRIESVRPQFRYKSSAEELLALAEKIRKEIVNAKALKKPLIHVEVTSEVDRFTYEKVERLLQPLCLKVRIARKIEEEGYTATTVTELESISVEQAVAEYLKMKGLGDKEASLAIEILRTLSLSNLTEKEAVAKTIEEIEHIFGVKSGESEEDRA